MKYVAVTATGYHYIRTAIYLLMIRLDNLRNNYQKLLKCQKLESLLALIHTRQIKWSHLNLLVNMKVIKDRYKVKL